ncbi:hypothetical protein HKX48_002804 [Thoreauomyces humboldtii]|nr:hypothetical protein HKX48_002804 [Thoreauomyces humboldtii]
MPSHVDNDHAASVERSSLLARTDRTLIHYLQESARIDGSKISHTYLLDPAAKKTTSLTFTQLDAVSAALAYKMVNTWNLRKGDRVLLLYPPGMSFLVAFMACFRAGVVGVPAYPPVLSNLKADLPKLKAIMDDSGASIALTSRDYYLAKTAFAIKNNFSAYKFPGNLKLHVTNTVSASGPKFTDESVTLDDLAFLQYTSGSTGLPKGVMITHGNMIHNLATAAYDAGMDEETTMVSWLPQYHDMGLCSGFLTAVLKRHRSVIMSPIDFIKNPMIWMQAMSDYGGTHSYAPNFGYELAARKHDSSKLAKPLDLSKVQFMMNAAEPVQVSTIEKFYSTFEKYNLKRSIINPGYGLAENTVFVCSSHRGELSTHNNRVCCGHAQPDVDIRIVDPETFLELSDGQEGEIWIDSASKALGYFRRKDNDQSFRARISASVDTVNTRSYLRTGDLGFKLGAGLYYSGRIKDLIIIRGRNYIPSDIESIASATTGIRPGCVAAFSVPGDTVERVVLVAELRASKAKINKLSLVMEIAEAVKSNIGISLWSVLLIAERSISKTTSGKIQRRKNQERYMKKEHKVLYEISGLGDNDDDSELSDEEHSSDDGFRNNSSGASQLASEMNSGADTSRPGTPFSDVLVRSELSTPSTASLVDSSLVAEKLTKTTLLQLSGPQRLAQLREMLTHAILANLGYAPSLEDSLIQRGMTSMQAVQLTARVELMLDFPLRASIFLEYPSIDAIATYISDLVETTVADERSMLRFPGTSAFVEQLDTKLVYDASPSQVRMWTASQAMKGSCNHVPQVLHVKGKFDAEAWNRAYGLFLQLHPILRTVFDAGDDDRTEGLKQVVLPIADVQVSFPVIDVLTLEQSIELARTDNADVDFDLEKGPLIRGVVYKLNIPDEWVLYVNYHHIVVDEWSLEIATKQLSTLYYLIVEDGVDDDAMLLDALPSPTFNFLDFTAVQQRALSGAKAEEELKFWKDSLAQVAPLQLPQVTPSNGNDLARSAAIYSGTITFEILQRFRALCTRAAATIFQGLLSVFNIVMSANNRSLGSDFAVGVPYSNRSSHDTSDIFGFFLNTLAIRANLICANGEISSQSFASYLGKTRETVLQAFQHAEVPFEKVLTSLGDCSATQRPDASVHPVFQVMFVYNDATPYRSAQNMIAGASSDVIFLEPACAKFELTMFVREKTIKEEGAELLIEYDSQRFTVDVIRKMTEHFVHILELVSKDSTLLLSMLSASDVPDGTTTSDISEHVAEPSRFSSLPAADEIAVRSISESMSHTEIQILDIVRRILEIEELGLHDNLIARGLNSLTSIRVTSAIKKQLGVRFSFVDIYKSPSVSDMAKLTRSHLRTTNDEWPASPLLKDACAIISKASFAQERMWVLQQLHRDSTYHVPMLLKCGSAITAEVMMESIKILQQRHAIFRTIFEMGRNSDQVFQRVLTSLPSSMRLVDLSSVPSALEETRKLALQDNEVLFDLTTQSSLRGIVFQLPFNEIALYLNIHHIATDEGSLDKMIREIWSIASALSSSKSYTAALDTWQYVDYANWQRKRLEKEDGRLLKEHMNFWREYLKEATPLLFENYTAQGDSKPQGQMEAIEIDAVYARKFEALCHQANCTAFIGYLAVYQILMSRFTTQMSFAVGVPITNRSNENTLDMLGLFVNTVVVNANINGIVSFEDLLVRVKLDMNKIQAHAEAPFEKVAQAISGGDPTAPALISNMFVMHSAAVSHIAVKGYAAGTELIDLALQNPKFPLSFEVAPTETGVTVKAEYATASICQIFVQRLLRGFKALVQQLSSQALSSRISDLDIVDAEDKHLMASWNLPPPIRLPHDSYCIQHRIQEHALRQPAHPAAVFADGQSLTYHELNAKANRLARYLQARSVGPDVLVALCMPRSLQMLVAMVAIHKAGGAYVPLDSQNPIARNVAIITRAKSPVVITESRFANLFVEVDALTVVMDGVDDTRSPWGTEAADNVVITTLTNKNLSYCLFTSGSTGEPKGVMIEHGSLLYSIHVHAERYRITKATRFLQFASYTFDVSVIDIFCTLAQGGTLCLAHKDDLLVDMGEIGSKMKVTFATLTPTVLSALLQPGEIPTLQGLGISGEAMTQPIIDRWAKHVILQNAYGPTEATVNVTMQHQLPGDRAGTIGRALPGSFTFILDSDLRQVPVGVGGELFLGGVQLARGYLAAPELTAERFIETSSLGRIYATGDLARYQPDGNIVYLGRTDHQVKLRGLRIELGEVEDHLIAYIAPQTANVGFRPTAAAESDMEAQSLAAECKAFAEKMLPNYMVPSTIVVIDRMPLTSAGKADRKAMPSVAGKRRKVTSQTTGALPTSAGESEQSVLLVARKVLDHATLGLEDNLFAFGMNSLTTIRFAALLNERFSTHLTITEVFESRTCLAVAGIIRKTFKMSRAVQFPKLSISASVVRVRASYAQEQMWTLQKATNDSSYNVPLLFVLRGTVSASNLAKAIHRVASTHGLFRTTFIMETFLMQIVHLTTDFDTSSRNLEGVSEASAIAQIQAHALKDNARSFDLQVSAWRATVTETSCGVTGLYINLHHIISDEFTVNWLMREISTAYNLLCKGSDAFPKAPAHQYLDFACWERENLESHDGMRMTKLMEFWKHIDGTPTLQLPKLSPAGTKATRPAGRVQSTIPVIEMRRFELLNESVNTTVFVGLMAVFRILLSRYASQSDFAIGTPVVQRDRVELLDMPGPMINTVALRTILNDATSFVSHLQEASAHMVDVLSHVAAPFEKVVQAYAKRSQSVSPIYQVMVFQGSNDELDDACFEGAKIETLEVAGSTAKIDLAFHFTTSKRADTVVTFEYDSSKFSAEMMEQLKRHFRQLFLEILARPNIPIKNLNYLTTGDKEKFVEWNSVKAETPQICAHKLIEMQVARTPSAIALAHFNGTSMTYAEMNARANKIARYLVAYGAESNLPIALCLDRSMDMIISILAVVKAGGAYLPLDPANPRERNLSIIEDANVKIILLNEENAPVFEGLGGRVQVIAVDSAEQPWKEQSGENVQVNDLLPSSLCYVLFTSGSTGKPKGVMIEHRAVTESTLRHIALEKLTTNDRVLQFSTYTFDYSVMDVFATLSAGATLCLATKLDILTYINRVFVEMEITFAMTTPSVISLLEESPDLALRTLAIGGEPMSQTVMDIWAHRVRLLNVYGPTEACVNVLIHEMTPGQDVRAIGRPLPNTTAYVLDPNLLPVPCGVVGDLFVGGPQLARGYHNRDDLTAAAFFMLESGERVYKTGDLAMFQPDGIVLCLGRVDNQIKLHGLRIELGEVERLIEPEIGDDLCAVMLVNGKAGEPSLVAFIGERSDLVPGEELTVVNAEDNKGSKFREQKLRQALKSKLPAYMMPSLFVFMKAFPKTASGKLDRKILAAFGATLDYSATSRIRTAPRTPEEQEVFDRITSLVGHTSFGVDEDFFFIGMHSILAIRLATFLQSRFAVELSIADIFEAGTVSGLCASIAARGPENEVSFPAKSVLKPHARRQLFRASVAQEKMWMLQQIRNDSTYHIPLMLHLQTPVDIAVLQSSVDSLLKRHSALRTTFLLNFKSSELMQVVHASMSVVILNKTFPSREARDIWATTNNQKPFDLNEGPLIRIAVLQTPSEKDVLYLNVHHIISDEWTMNLILLEIGNGCLTSSRLEIIKPAAQLQYVDFSQWQRASVREAKSKSKLDYWTVKLRDVPVLYLPVKTNRRTGRAAATSQHDLGKLDDFNDICKNARCSTFMGLLAVLQVLLYRYSGQTDFAIGSPVSTRQHAATMSMLGLFLNTVAFRADIVPEESFDTLLGKVRDTVLQGLRRKDVPFEQVVEQLNETREDVDANPIYQVMLVQNSSADRKSSGIFDGCSIQDLKPSQAKLDVLFAVTVAADGNFDLSIEYDSDKFENKFISQMGQNLLTLISSICASSATELSRLRLLDSKTRDFLLSSYVDPENQHIGRCIHHVFEDAVRDHPENVAIDFYRGSSVSYAELNASANKLAVHLRSMGIGPDQAVALLADKSIAMVVAILAIVKAGGCYIPLDPQHPVQRLNNILGQTSCSIVLADKKYLSIELAVLNVLDISDTPLWEANPANNLLIPELKDSDLAYYLFTSGTTGAPKGVQTEHRHVLQAMLQTHETYGLSPIDRHLQFAAYTFDVSVGDIFGTLTKGATLCMASREAMMTNLPKLMREMRITVAALTPSVVSALLHPDDVPTLKRMTVSGEAMLPSILQLWADRIPIFNGYGPTEVTIHSSLYRMSSKHDPMDVGNPFKGVSYYVLDQHMEPMPFGIVGEIYIGGQQVSRGYLGMPEVTAEKFVYGPAGRSDRIYRTGDLGYAREDGCFTFVGRIGTQVKIRGLRIELGEITSAITSALPEFLTSAVIVTKHNRTGQAQLIAFAAKGNENDGAADYVVLQSNWGKQEMEAVRPALQTLLPDYMIPEALIELSHIPRTPSGKVDTRKLLLTAGNLAPATATSEEITVKQQPKRTANEIRVMEIVNNVLGIQVLDVSSDLFAAGMNSLGVMKLCGAIGREFEKEVTVSAVFAGPTVRQIASHIQGIVGEATQQKVSMVVPGINTTTIASYAQARMWYLTTITNDNMYNVPLFLKLSEKLTPERAQSLLSKIRSRHSVLRTTLSYDAEFKMVLQTVHAKQSFTVEARTALSIEDAYEHAIEDNKAAFNLEKSLMRAVIYQVNNTATALYLNLHHAITDEWTINLIVSELRALWHGTPLLPSTIQYADFSIWQRNLLEENGRQEKESQLAFWEDHLKDTPSLVLPVTGDQDTTKNRTLGALSMNISANLVKAFRSLCSGLQATEFMGYFSLFNVLIWRYTGRLDFAVGTPVSNREGSAMNNVMGMFVNTLALRSQITPNMSFTDYLSRIRQSWIAALRNSQIPFEAVVERVGGAQVRRNPLFQVMFVQQTWAEEETSDHFAELLPVPNSKTKFDLTATMQQGSDGVLLRFEYDADSYSEDSMRRLAQMYVRLLESVNNDASTELACLCIVPKEDRVSLHQLQKTGRLSAAAISILQKLGKQGTGRDWQIYIMDQQLQQVPFAVEGEICIGGEHVTSEYFEEDALLLVENPFKSGGKLYKSGQYGYMKPTGEIGYFKPSNTSTSESTPDNQIQSSRPCSQQEEALASIVKLILDCDEIQADENFFAAGMTSISVVQLIGGIYAGLKTRLTFVEVYDHPSIALLTNYISNKNALLDDSFPKVSALAGANTKDLSFPASPTQERMWLLQNLHQDDTYHVPLLFLTDLELSFAHFQDMIATTISRHSILRTTFQLDARGELQQIVHYRLHTVSEYLDLTSEAHPLEAAKRIASTDLSRTFDLAEGPLTRWKLMKINEKRSAVYVCIHHALVDDASIRIILRELSHAHQKIYSPKAPLPSPVPLQYVDYSGWQRKRLEKAEGALATAQREYWSKQLACLPVMHWPLQNTDSNKNSATNLHKVFLSASAATKFDNLCASQACTPFVGFLSLYFILLSRHSDSTDLAVGTAVNVRDDPRLSDIMGPCINTVAIRATLEADLILSEVFKQVKSTVLGALKNSQLPFEQVIREVASSERIFKTMFVLENSKTAEQTAHELVSEWLPLVPNSSKFDLLFSTTSLDTGYDLAIQYDRTVLSSSFVETFLSRFLTLVANVCEEPSARLGSAKIMTEEESMHIINELNPQCAIPKEALETCMYELVEAQVDRTPNGIAFLSEDGSSVSYEDMNAQANKLGRHLQLLRVQSEEIVLLCFANSPAMGIAMLAVQKIGCAYCIVDSAAPGDRIKSILSQSRSKIVVAAEEFCHIFQDTALQIVSFSDSNNPWASLPGDNIAHMTSPSSLMYVLFTSGNAGSQGVTMEHRAVVAATKGLGKRFGFSNRTRHLQFAKATTDVSVMEIYLCLTSGATLCLAFEHSLQRNLRRACQDMMITSLALTPSVLSAYLKPGDVETLEVIITAGEVLSQRLMDTWCENITLFNAYSRTETVGYCAYLTCQKGEDPGRFGSFVPGVKAYILDENMQLVPEGRTGQLYLGGVQLARGYIGRQGDKFVPNPYTTGGQLYATGDMACYSQNTGSLVMHHVGRSDSQVQIDGMRVELQEIQTLLDDAPCVSSCGILYRDELRVPTLVAYVLLKDGVPKENLAESIESMESHLRAKLPEFMVPTKFRFIEYMPYTTSGKVDRFALMELDHESESNLAQNGVVVSHDGVRVTPRKFDRHLDLTRIWSDILGVPDIKATDTFFELGGHSLLAVKLKSMIEKHFNIAFPMPSIYNYPGLADMAAHIDTLTVELRRLEDITDEGTAAEEISSVEVDDVIADFQTTPILQIRAPEPLIDDGKPKLFIIHALFGMAYSYATLGPYVRIPTYGIANPRIGQNHFKSVTEMAYHHVQLVRKVQHKGPYYLAGHSAGGNIAIEMARILQSFAGEKVVSVILLDSVHPSLFPPTHDVTVEGARTMACEQGLTGASADRAAKALYDEAHHSYGLLLAQQAAPIWAGRYEGSVTLLKAIDETENPDPFNGWSDDLPNLVVKSIRGEHQTILNVDSAAATGAALQESIDEAHPTLSSQLCLGLSLREANYLHAVRRGDRLMAARLLDVGRADANVTEPHTGRTALHIAIENEADVPMIVALLDRGINVSISSLLDGVTALELASRSRLASLYGPIFEATHRNERRREISRTSPTNSASDAIRSLQSFIKTHFDIEISARRVAESGSDIGVLTKHLSGQKVLQAISAGVAVEQNQRVLMQHPSVQEAIVKQRNKQYLAFIELVQSDKPASERRTIMEFVREHRNKLDVLPSVIINLAHLPRKEDGSIDSEAIDNMLPEVDDQQLETLESVQDFVQQLLTFLLKKPVDLHESLTTASPIPGTLSQLLALLGCKWPMLTIEPEIIFGSHFENAGALSSWILENLKAPPEKVAAISVPSSPSFSRMNLARYSSQVSLNMLKQGVRTSNKDGMSSPKPKSKKRGLFEGLLVKNSRAKSR